MATQRINIDTRGKNILEIFMDNMNELSSINKLSAGPGDANTYDESDGREVNITWPRAGNYNTTGMWPDVYQRYFVREITGPVEYSPSSGEVPLNAPLTPNQNDLAIPGWNNSGIQDSFAGKSPRVLEYADNPYSNKNASGGSGHQAGNFFKLKSRKSLFTLLQETMGAFFDKDGVAVYRNPMPGPQQPNNEFNKYGDNYQSYDYQYMATQGPSFVDPPAGIDFTWQAMAGYNLGQTLGGNVTIEDRLRTQAQNITRDIFTDLAGAAGAADNEFIANYYARLSATLVPVERISQLYVPGWGRPSENWLTKKPLSENLNQNLLLPPTSGELGGMNPTDVAGNTNNNGSGGPGFGNTEATFQSLYTRNRAGLAGGVNIGNPIFNNGMIAGTPITALQEPSDMEPDLIKAGVPPPNTVTVPFTFEEDDAKYLTYAKKETGFTSNGPKTSVDPSRAEPAVNDLAAMTGGRNPKPYHLGESTVRLTQGQHFPFAFSTVNKKRGGQQRFQVCYLQAIINSLSESYTPTWNARHFFGRSEQAHTYTFTDRTIDVGFTIFANEMRQLQNVYERVVWLAQQCYPDYDLGGRMSEGPIIAMRVGDLFQYKAGMIRSLSYDWMFGGGKWEMTSGMRMPQGCTVTMSYQVIHESMPNRDTDFYGGPLGGLNSATERYREISGGTQAGNAFDAFEDTQTGSVGFGHRLIDSGEKAANLDEVSFIKSVKEANKKWMDAENSGRVDRSTDLSVPIGVDPTTKDLIYA
tara:strand:+ start:2851 stop:5106 length:2256 start_codon:yes stop_codon:yes gene_type:complete